MKRFLLISMAGLCLLSVACTDAERSKMNSYGGRHKVTLYSGGNAVRVFHSTGAILNEKDSDGYYFEDTESHKLVTVSGTVVIELE